MLVQCPLRLQFLALILEHLGVPSDLGKKLNLTIKVNQENCKKLPRVLQRFYLIFPRPCKNFHLLVCVALLDTEKSAVSI